MSTVVKRRIRWRIRCPFREFTLELFLNARVSDDLFRYVALLSASLFCSELFLAKLTGMCIAVSYLRKPSSIVRSSWFVRPSHRRPLSGVRSPLTHDVYQEPTMNTRRNEFGELPKT